MKQMLSFSMNVHNKTYIFKRFFYFCFTNLRIQFFSEKYLARKLDIFIVLDPEKST